MKKVDYTGKVNGKLICLKELEGKNILVKCECGIEKIINRRDFGKTKTCGHGRRKHDIIGKKFGKLKVLGFMKSIKKYECKCSCGNIRFNLGKDLVDNHIASCGCLKEKNKDRSRKKWLNKKIGKYTVTKYLGMRPQKNNPNKFDSWFEVKCECGSIREKNISHLYEAQSCGCVRSSPEYLNKVMKNFKKSADVKTIRSLKHVYSIEEIAAMFEMSESSVKRILSGTSYKWIGNDK